MNMTPEQSKAVQELRAQGWAVILWTPEELGEVDPSSVEDQSIQFAAEYLLPDPDDTDAPDYATADRFQLGE